MDIGKRIKDKRKKDGISAKELSSLLDVPMDRIYKWEKGSKPASAEDFLLVTKWLDGELENAPNKIAIDYSKESMAKDIIQLKALVKMLRHRCAKLEAKVFDKDLDEILEEQDDDTRINIKDLVNSK